MSHKLIYALTKEKREAYKKIVPNSDEAIIELLKQVGASTFTSLNDGKRILPDGREVKFKVENVDNVKIPLVTAAYYGQKGTILCSEPLFTVLVNACKLDNYLRRKDGVPMISFNQFIDNLINIHISSVIGNHQKQLLDQSMKELEIPNKTKK